MRKLYIILLVIVLIVAGCAAWYFMRPVYSGTKVANPNEIVLTYADFNMKDTYFMDLNAGDRLDITVFNVKGNISITANIDGDEPIYQGRDIPTGGFSVNVDKSGKYIFTIKGSHAGGSTSIIRVQG